MKVKLYTDGNLKPGPCLGIVIRDMDDNILKIGGMKLAKGDTSNVCEYSALIAGLNNCLILGATKVAAHLDSQLVQRQCNGQYRVNEPHLKPYHAEVKRLVAEFELVTFKWIPRLQNAHADEAARSVWV